jgi:hypothetical protein
MNLRRTFATSILLTLLGMTGGCGALGVPLYTVFGDPPIPAQYDPPKVPTLVLVENARSPGDVQVDADQIAQQVCEELRTKAKMDIIDPDKVAELREEDPKKYHAMYVGDIGKAVGAKQVIYIDLIESAVTGDVTQTTIHAQAKMDFDSMDSSKAMAMHMDLLTQLSSQISKLFYTWKPDDQSQEDAGG